MLVYLEKRWPERVLWWGRAFFKVNLEVDVLDYEYLSYSMSTSTRLYAK